MTLLDVSIVNVALPSIQKGLGEDALPWIVSGYALSLGLLPVPAGRIGDARAATRIHRRRGPCFVLASAGCGIAPSGLVLVIARVPQGFVGGLVTPQIGGVIQSLVQGEERGKAFGLFGTTVGISTTICPLLSGAPIALFGAHSGAGGVLRQRAERGRGARPRPAVTCPRRGRRLASAPSLTRSASPCSAPPSYACWCRSSNSEPGTAVATGAVSGGRRAADPVGAPRASLRTRPRTRREPRPVQDPLLRSRDRGRHLVLRRLRRLVIFAQSDLVALAGARATCWRRGGAC